MLSIRPTQLRVDLSAIRHNVREVAEAAAPAKVLAVVKANAYGHGAVQVSQAALEAGMNAHAAKPTDMRALCATLLSLIKRA